MSTHHHRHHDEVTVEEVREHLAELQVEPAGETRADRERRLYHAEHVAGLLARMEEAEGCDLATELDVPEVAFDDPDDPDPPVIEELRAGRHDPPATGAKVLPFRQREGKP